MNSPESNEKTVYRFDGFVVDAQNYVVTRGDETVALAPRAFDVLVLLLRHSGQVVEKRQMFDEVWGETFVSDNALTKIIKELRQALGDSADHPRYIETVPKRGYKFIGEVGPGPAGAGNDPDTCTRPGSNIPHNAGGQDGDSVCPDPYRFGVRRRVGLAFRSGFTARFDHRRASF